MPKTTKHDISGRRFGRLVWDCKIGGKIAALPPGADAPMRRAVEECFVKLTGAEPEFLFSGWGGKLTEPERAVVEKRQPVFAAPASLPAAAQVPPMLSADGVSFRVSGFPHVGRISREIGDWLCKHCELLEHAPGKINLWRMYDWNYVNARIADEQQSPEHPGTGEGEQP